MRGLAGGKGKEVQERKVGRVIKEELGTQLTGRCQIHMRVFFGCICLLPLPSNVYCTLQLIALLNI